MDGSLLSLTFAALADTPPGLAMTEELVLAPLRAALAEHLAASAAHTRFLTLRDQIGPVVRRQSIASARVAKLVADKELVAAEAPADAGKKLARLTKDIAAAELERQQAEAELLELGPLRDAARADVRREVGALAYGLVEAAKSSLKRARDDAEAEALQGLLAAAGTELGRLAALEATLGAMPTESDVHDVALDLIGTVAPAAPGGEDQTPTDAPVEDAGDTAEPAVEGAVETADVEPETAAATA